MNLRIVIALGLAAAFLFGESRATADKESDFKTAAASSGCKAIPYSSLKSSCNSQQSYVHDWCDGGKGPVKCNKGGSAGLKTALKKEKEKLEDLKEKKKDLERKRSRSSDDKEKSKLKDEIDDVDDDIYKAKKAIDKLEDDLDDREDLIDKTIYNIGKCVDYRRAVMNVFGDALDKVRGESDPKLKSYATTLRNKYQASKRGHEIAIKDKENALSICKKEEL